MNVKHLNVNTAVFREGHMYRDSFVALRGSSYHSLSSVHTHSARTQVENFEDSV